MNLFRWLFGKKSTMKEIKKDFVVPPTPKQNFRHITPYKSDSRIADEIERKRRYDDNLLTNLAIASMLIDNDSNNSSSSSYESTENDSRGFDGGFGGGGFSGSGAGASWEDNSSSSHSSYDSGSSYSSYDLSSSYDSGSSSYDSGSSYDSSSSSSSDW